MPNTHGSIMTLALTTSILCTSALAIAGPQHPPRDPAAQIEQMTELLDLDADTVEAIQAIHEDAKAESQPIGEEIRLAREDQRALVEDGATDLEILAAAARVMDLKTELQLLRLESKLHVRALLTEDQRLIMREFKENQKNAERRRRIPQGL